MPRSPVRPVDDGNVGRFCRPREPFESVVPPERFVPPHCRTGLGGVLPSLGARFGLPPRTAAGVPGCSRTSISFRNSRRTIGRPLQPRASPTTLTRSRIRRVDFTTGSRLPSSSPSSRSADPSRSRDSSGGTGSVLPAAVAGRRPALSAVLGQGLTRAAGAPCAASTTGSGRGRRTDLCRRAADERDR